MTIELTPYASAILLAGLEFSDYMDKKNGRKKHIPRYIFTELGNGRTGVEKNPEYVEEDPEVRRVNRWKRENIKREWTISYLKEHYPNEDYAEQYEKNNKWNLPLIYPTEESKKCEYLHEDGRHCTMKRDETTCYTCCFVCKFPDMCWGTNCPLLPEDRIELGKRSWDKYK